MSNTTKRYPKTLRNKAVRLVAEGGTMRAVAEKLGINSGLVYYWVKRDRDTSKPVRRTRKTRTNVELPVSVQKELAYLRAYVDYMNTSV